MLRRASTVSIGQLLLRPLRWWSRQLAAVIPSSLVEILRAWPCTLRLYVDGDAYRLTVQRAKLLRRSGPEAEIAAGQWADVVQKVASKRRVWRRLLAVELVVPEVNCLFLNKEIPLAAGVKSADIVALEIDRLVPLPAIELYSAYYPAKEVVSTTDQALRMTIAVCKRRLLDPAIRRLSDLSIQPVALRIEDAQGKILPVDLFANHETRDASFSRILNVLTIGTTVAASMVWIGGNVIEFVQKRSLRDNILNENKVLQNQALSLNKRRAADDAVYSRIGDVRNRKVTEVGLIAIWEEITRIFPTTTWLNELRLEDDVVSVDGFSSSAAELLGLLSASAYFKEPEFLSPITHDQQTNLERFFLRFKLKRKTSAPSRMDSAELPR